MKKLLALLLVSALMLCFAACGKTETPEEKKEESSTPVSSRVEDPEEPESSEESSKEPLVLDGDEEFVVIGRKDAEMLNSIKDIKGKNVGTLFDSDGEKIAKYYGADFIGFGSDGDCYSGMLTANSANSIDYIIVREMSLEERMSMGYPCKVVLEKIVIE